VVNALSEGEKEGIRRGKRKGETTEKVPTLPIRKFNGPEGNWVEGEVTGLQERYGVFSIPLCGESHLRVVKYKSFLLSCTATMHKIVERKRLSQLQKKLNEINNRGVPG